MGPIIVAVFSVYTDCQLRIILCIVAEPTAAPLTKNRRTSTEADSPPPSPPNPPEPLTMDEERKMAELRKNSAAAGPQPDGVKNKPLNRVRAMAGKYDQLQNKDNRNSGQHRAGGEDTNNDIDRATDDLDKMDLENGEGSKLADGAESNNLNQVSEGTVVDSGDATRNITEPAPPKRSLERSLSQNDAEDMKLKLAQTWPEPDPPSIPPAAAQLTSHRMGRVPSFNIMTPNTNSTNSVDTSEFKDFPSDEANMDLDSSDQQLPFLSDGRLSVWSISLRLKSLEPRPVARLRTVSEGSGSLEAPPRPQINLDNLLAEFEAMHQAQIEGGMLSSGGFETGKEPLQ